MTEPECPYVKEDSYQPGSCAGEGPNVLCYKQSAKVQTRYCPCKEWEKEKEELEKDWVPEWMKRD